MNQNNLRWSWFTLLTIIAVAYGNDPLYTISAPNVLRPGSIYQLVVTVHQAPAPVAVHATLTARNGGNDTLPMEAEATVNSGETKLMEIKVGPNTVNNYELNVVGSGGITFNKSSFINTRSKTFSIFIQTDKAIYKPGQLVHFRVIATDSLLKPYNTDAADIYVIDSQGNRIKQWRNATLTNGIFTGDLQLSDQVLLGDWQIRVEIKNKGQSSESVEMETKSFTIEEYVLPTFEVDIQLPSIVTYNQSEMVATVIAKYTYGKPVKGDVTLNVSDFYCQYPCISSGAKPFTVKTSVDGKAEVKLNLVQDLALPEWYRYGQRRFMFFASVTEALTGRQQNGTKDMTLYEHRHKIEFVQTSTFKPGLKYSATLKVTMQDGSPVIDDHNNVTVSYSYNWNDARTPVTFPVPRDGLITVELFPPETADTIRFEANYLGATSYSTASRAQSLSERYLQINLKTENPKVGDEVELVVDATKDLNDALVIQVVGRGKILHVENIAGSKSTSQVFKVKLTPEMAPKVRVIVFYTTPCGEVVADALDFGVEGVFKTPVAVSVKPNSTEPGDAIQVNVATHPHAYVGLLAVDQSVLLLKSGNDLSTEQILNDLQGYEIGYISPYDFDGGSRYLRPWRPSSTTTMQLFSNVGLIFLTNGLLARMPQPHYGGYGGGFGGAPGYAMRGRNGGRGRGRGRIRGKGGALPRPVSLSGPAMTTSANRQEVAMKVGSNLVEPSRVRRHFPETFLWTNATADNDGNVQLNVDAPDTITSYIINAFAMDQENGLGLAASPAKLQIFRPFFVTLNLPYSIVRGETVALQALVFNYLKEEVEAVVTLDNQEGNFVLLDLENEVTLPAEQKEVTKKVKVAPGVGASVLFVVSPKKLGYIDLKVTAKSTVAADALIKQLLVKAEGTPVYFNKGFLIDLRNESRFERSVDITVPEDHVSESERVEISAIGDVMGTTVNNLDKLLRMPYGCGEQNMVNFVPNIAITEYLNRTGQLTEEIKSKALKYMESGYQRELTYKRVDASYSAFGKSDKNGSTWLTAFVVKSFIQARPYIPVEDQSIIESLRWLASYQAENGSFQEVGSVFNKAMQGGSGKGLALSAYVLSTFLETKANKIGRDVPKGVLSTTPSYSESQAELPLSAVIGSTVALLEKEFIALDSIYDLVLTTYVLHLADSKEKDNAFAKMNQVAHAENDVMYWSQPLPEVNASDPWSYYNRPRSVDVEMTAYALLTYSLRDQLTDAIPIMRWLISKRNENGGFESTQDTVVGIQALAKFAEKLAASKDASVDVTFSYDDGKKTLQLNRDNALILHREQLPRTVRNIGLSATGNGVGIVQVTWSYNIDSTSKTPAFEVHTNATEISNDLTVNACTKYTYEDGESNMAVMEIGFPSGYVADREGLPVISEETKIKRVDTKNGDTVVVVYFDKIGKEVCTSAAAHRTTKVAEMKPAHIEVYDYYDLAKRGEVYYNAPKVAVCDLCESDECKKKCK